MVIINIFRYAWNRRTLFSDRKAAKRNAEKADFVKQTGLPWPNDTETIVKGL